MTPVRTVFSLFLSIVIIIPCWSQIDSNPWSFPKSKQALSTTKNFPQKHIILQLQEEILSDILDQTPLRFSAQAKSNPTVLTLPLGDGTLEEFIIEEAPVLHPDLTKKYPNIRSFAGQSMADPTTTVRFSWSPKGLQALIIGAGNTSVIDTYNSSNIINHVVYNRKDRKVVNNGLECTIRRQEDRHSFSGQSRSQQAGDCQLRTYRLALACTGEYAQYHGGTIADALAAMNASITRINGVFENELAVSLQIIPNNSDIIFLNPSTDPYDNFDGVEMLDQNQETIDEIIGSSNYDVGHVFSTGGGGIAGLGVICSFRSKAEGVTGSDEPEGDFFDIDFVAHEFGHQFGAEHTFNGTREACGGNNRWLPSAVEPGGGSTIMAYAGICGSQNVQNQSDVYFHAQSLEEISNFLTSDDNDCAQLTDLNNDAPIADAGADHIIPKSTPFVLSGISSDPNGGALSYTWEQMDRENSTQPPASTNSGGPLFRSNPPTTSPDRFFPDLRFLARNLDNRWEVLPSVARDLSFRFTVRDNNMGGGCTDEDDMNIIVNDQAGPFLVLAPNTSDINWIGGAKEIVTWDVANTSASPINEDLVDILLSVDGGLSFTQTILSNTPNTGTAEVIVPNVETDEARIMIRASNNIFFDISNFDFAIEPVRDDFLVFIDEANKETCLEIPATYQVEVNVSGTLDGSVALSTTGLPTGIVSSFSNNDFIPPNEVNLTLLPDQTVAPGTYDFVVNITGTTGTQTRDLSLTIVDTTKDLVLDTPTNNNEAVEPTATFAWNELEGAEKYTLQIATDLGFSNPITYADITANAFSIPNSLASNTRYYWKVIAEGACLSNKESETFTFLTSNIACKIYDSEEVPIEISTIGAPTITSTITIPDEGIVTDVNVLNLQIDHTFVSDLAIGLSNPAEDVAILLFFPCLFEENVNINFDDDDAESFESIPCPPADGGRYNSLDALSVFDGSAANGDWVLVVNDDADDDGGSLNSWSLEVCFLQESLVAALSVNAMKTDETCFGMNDGTASVNALDGTGDYSFIWSNGETDASIDNLAPGIYTVTVSDGVTDIVESTMVEAAPEIVKNFDIANQSCSDVEDGQITALSTVGVDLDYLWPDGSTEPSFGNLSTGTYEVEVTERTSGCSTIEVLEVSAPDPIIISTIVQNVSCSNANDASIIPSVIGGLPPYEINNSDLINLPEGNYMVFVTDANNCAQVSLVSVAEPSPIAIEFSSSPISRVGAMDGSISATASGGNDGYTYKWSNSATDATINNLAEGSYDLTVTDQNGCETTASTTIAGIECSTISIQLNTEQDIINGSDGRISATVDELGTYTYLWSTGNTTNTITDLPVGTYSVTVTDEKGCTATQSVVLNEVDCSPFSVNFTVENITELGGSDGSITASVDGQGTYTYLWSTGDTTTTITDLSSGTYNVTITDENECSEIQTLELEGFDCTPFSIDFVTFEPNCGATNGMINTTITSDNGPFIYNWSTGSEDSAITDLPSGNYSVTVTDISGCFSVSDVLLTEGTDSTPPTIDCPQNRVMTNSCNIPVVYELVTGDDCSMVQLELLQGLESGSEFPQGETLIEYLAIDDAGNTATCSFMVTQISDMSLEYDPTFLIPNTGDQILFAFDLKCSIPNEAIANFVSVNGGVPPFTYEVFEGSNGGSATVYLVTVTDARGCLLVEEVNFLNINDTEGLISPILEVAIQDVSTGADGGIVIEVDDRFGMVSYTWTNDNTIVSTNQNLENVEVGNYTLTIVDEFGCSYTSDYDVQMLTSTNQLLLEETVLLMPNPNTGNFQIQITLPNPVPVSIELYDVNGRLLQPAIQQENSNVSIDFNISNFPKGIYFTKISAEQEVIVKRVVLL